ncbi:MAG: hypothetical protein JST58_04770 [Bacteroidetes bacterium]|nr:hypothetical protein [Bacteroidota bacterium]
MSSKSNYKKKLEIFRTYYKTNTGENLDDELLHIIIKISEAHADLKKDISTKKIVFLSAWDYFMFGLGSLVTATIMSCFFIILFLLLHK